MVVIGTTDHSGDTTMDASDGDALDWTVRSHVYRHILEYERPPTISETATGLGIEPDQARAAYHRLHRRHALFLDPGSDAVRMAHPFSFRSEDGVDGWCARTGVPRGEVLTIEQTWALAQAWYHHRLHPDFRGRTVDQAQEIFCSLGLDSPFWRADATA